MHDPYDPHHPEFAGEGGHKIPDGRWFGRLWLRPDGPRVEVLVIRDGEWHKFRGQLHEVETNDDD